MKRTFAVIAVIGLAMGSLLTGCSESQTPANPPTDKKDAPKEAPSTNAPAAPAQPAPQAPK